MEKLRQKSIITHYPEVITMYEIGNILIVTQKEYDEYEKKAKQIQDQRESHELNMKLRFPYYIPTAEEVESHKNVSVADLFPYFVYLTTTDDNGKYLVEPDNEELNNTRIVLNKEYRSRIFVMDNEEEAKRLVEILKKDKEKPQNT